MEIELFVDGKSYGKWEILDESLMEIEECLDEAADYLLCLLLM